MANLTFAKNSLLSSPLKTCYKSEFITPFVPSLIPVPPIRLRKRWTKKPQRHGGCPETSYLLQYIYENYCQVFQGRGKGVWNACVEMFAASHTQRSAGVWLEWGTEELCTCPHVPSAPRAASPLMVKGWVLEAAGPSVSILLERAAVVSEKCLLASSCVLTGNTPISALMLIHRYSGAQKSCLVKLPNIAYVKKLDFCRCFSLLILLLHQNQRDLQHSSVSVSL